jgi:Uncharacterized conserved protein (DUF2183)
MQPIDPTSSSRSSSLLSLRGASLAPAAVPLEASPAVSSMAPSPAQARLDDSLVLHAEASATAAPTEVAPKAPPKRGFIEGVDGFVAYDPSSGKILAGRAPGARLRKILAGRAPGARLRKKVPLPEGLDTLSKVAARGVQGEQMEFTLGDRSLTPSKLSGRQGEQRLDIDQLGRVEHAPYSQPLCLDVACGDLPAAQARVLALPANYDGPIFVTDIDDTLRATEASALLQGKVQEPLPGAKELLDSVAAMGIPIVYLSAAPSQLHSVNERFLKQLPPGVLLDHPRYTATNLLPGHAHQAAVQGAYKANVLRELQATFPQARFYELGDDKYGDARAYNELGQ